MAARRQHNRKIESCWINRQRYYNFDTYNSNFSKSDGTEIKFSTSGFKRAAQNFDTQFSTEAERFTEYNVTRRDGKYQVTQALPAQ